MTKKLALLLFSSTLIFSCQEKEEAVTNPVASQMMLSFNHDGVPVSSALTNTTALLYDGTILSKKAENLQMNENGLYVIATDKAKADKLLIIAGDHEINSSSASEDYLELTQETTATVNFSTTFPQLFYTGERTLSNLNNASIELSLMRSVARLDVKKLTQLEVIIDSCIITNLATKSYLLPGNTSPIPSMEYKTQSLSADLFADLANGVEGATYFYESTGVSPEVTLYTQINGIKNRLKVTLPETIVRNKRYEIAINGSGAVLFADLNVLPWEEGGSIEAKPENFTAKIDLENSQLPAGVRANASQDTLYIGASFDGTFVLALDAPTETEVKMESSHIEVTPVVNSRSLYTGNLFEMKVKMNEINKPTMATHLYVKAKTESQYYDRHLVIIREGYRTRFDGLKVSSLGHKVNYSYYVDGDLATINSEWEIVSVTSQSVDEQFNWVRTQEHELGYLLEGGFKPNDTEARGQEQVSVVTVTYADNHAEEFLLNRKRNSIPVITQGGLYWAKYNMRGNSKKYDDQISFDRDMPRNELYDYLKTCSDEEFTYYVGAEYRGTSTDGLYLKRDMLSGDSILLYEGYSSIPDGQISNGPADAHCPPGYKMPTLAEWQYIFYTGGQLTIPASGTTNPYNASIVSLAAADPTSNSSNDRNRYRIDRHTRSVVVDGVEIPEVSIFKITDIRFYEGEEMIFLGFGNQSSPTAITLGQSVYPIVTTGPTHFVMNFLTNRTSYGNLSGTGVHTRTIRCVKTPTNFIVE